MFGGIDLPVEFLYCVVIVLCAWLFLKASKAAFKVALVIGIIVLLVIYVIPKYI